MKADIVPVKRSRVRAGLSESPLVDAETGQVVAASVIHQFVDVDTDQFVKVFESGIAAAYELSRAGQRVFQAVLGEYQKAPMSGGFVDSVYLAWFDGGLSGRDIGMSDRTFARGLRELLDKTFLAPREPNVFWVNPALFFKGDRVQFVREIRRASRVIPKALLASNDHSTSDVIAGVVPASFPRQPLTVGGGVSREKTEPQYQSKPSVPPPAAFRFGKKKRGKR